MASWTSDLATRHSAVKESLVVEKRVGGLLDEEVPYLLVINQDSVLHRSEFFEVSLQILIAEFFLVVHFENIFKFLVRYITIIVFIDFFDVLHYLDQLVVCLDYFHQGAIVDLTKWCLLSPVEDTEVA